MKPLFFRAFALILIAFLSSHGVLATEKILNFESDIIVNKDGSLLVTETIHVKAEGRSIKRGIYRDFPVRYREDSGLWRYVGFDIQKVTKDGVPENFFAKSIDSYRRIYAGKKSVYLRPGEYVYKFTYKTTRQLRFFKEFDELYWNVNGTKWRFMADKVRANITLPEGATILQSQAFTGRFKQVGTDFEIIDRGDRKISFETTRPLQTYEGLTIAIGWQKGIVDQPSRLSTWLWRLWDNFGLVILLFGTVAVLVYFWAAWNRVGRDPEGGVIIPLFGPPNKMSPGAVSYAHYQKFKGKGGGSLAFIAALVSLAVKGRLTITETKSKLKVSRETYKSAGLSKGERAIYKRLLGSRKTLTFKTSTSATVQSARTNFRSAITDEFGGVLFNSNLFAYAIGVGLSILTLLGFFLFFALTEDSIISIFINLISALLGSYLLSIGIRRLADTIPGGSSKLWGLLFTVLGCFVIFPAIIMPIGDPDLPFWVPICITALAVANVMFLTLLRAPTELGQQVMDQIEGFKLYLSVAEADRMNMEGAPNVDQITFEKFLPYAIGLGVEKPWSKAFESYMTKVGSAQAYSQYSPTWYHGSRGWSNTDIGAATAGIVAGVSSGMAQASPPSTSGSGGGGGGFSGGGGGGGGGGGW